VTLALIIKLKSKLLKKGVDISDFQEIIKYLPGLDSDVPNNYKIKLDPESLIKKAHEIHVGSEAILKKGWEEFLAMNKRRKKESNNLEAIICHFS
jgi:hypothetical protein